MWVALVQGCVFRLFCRACICSLCNCDSFYKPLWFLHCESHRQTSVSGKSSPSGLWSEHSHPKHCGLWCYVWSIKHCGLWCYDWSIIMQPPISNNTTMYSNIAKHKTITYSTIMMHAHSAPATWNSFCFFPRKSGPSCTSFECCSCCCCCRFWWCSWRCYWGFSSRFRMRFGCVVAGSWDVEYCWHISAAAGCCNLLKQTPAF